MKNNEQTRLLLAVVLTGAILFGWQYFFTPKQQFIAPATNGATAVSVNSASAPSATNNAINSATSQNPTNIPVQNEEMKTVSLNGHEFTLSNTGFVVSAKNPKAISDVASIVGSDKIFALEYLDEKLVLYKRINFNKLSVENTRIVGVNEALGVSFIGELKADGKLSYELKSNTPIKWRFVFISKEAKESNRQSREFLVFNKSVTRYTVGSDKSNEDYVKWFALDYDLHLFAVTFAKEISSIYKLDPNGQIILSLNEAQTALAGNIVFTKKNYDDLTELGENLKHSVDFGFFGILAVPILRGLQFFYKVFPNYGIAIILLTILLRLITFPLQYKSFKSMKKMQSIQPEMNKIREKYKDEPQRLQQESMALFKRSGVNPLSGCLPILLQLPIFFAFFKVLYNAVELVHAPFYFWIQDLSMKDPFYILPIIMTVAMYFQQKMTPTTTMDPTQQKIMQFMPVVFGLFMLNFPAGLALYTATSTILGIFQQMLVYRMIK